MYRKSGNLCKKIVFCLLLLTFSFRLAAQIDYLEPVKPFSTYTGELGEYYRSVFSLLNTGFQKQPYARFAAIPSFSPEYAMSVEKKNGRCLLIANTLSRTYWQAEKGTVKVETKSVEISQSLYQSLGAIARLVTSQIQDLDGSTAGLDGVVYYFSSTDAKGKEMMGRKWSPMKGLLMERLVWFVSRLTCFSGRKYFGTSIGGGSNRFIERAGAPYQRTAGRSQKADVCGDLFCWSEAQNAFGKAN